MSDTVMKPPGLRGSPDVTPAGGPVGTLAEPKRAVRDASRRQPALAMKLRLVDGRVYERALAPERHRRIQLGLLHAGSDGYVELAAGRRPPGCKLSITTRRDPGHFLPGGATATTDWLSALLQLAGRHVAAGDEVFIAPAVRSGRGASKAHVAHTHWLWIDVDGSDGLPAVKGLLRCKPAHLVVSSGGSGGVHCYWRLRTPLAAQTELIEEPIERAHERLVYALGYSWQAGRPVPTVADGACRDRSRVMRLAGTINGKSGEHARLLWADFALAPWTLGDLIGDLPSSPRPQRSRRRSAASGAQSDPYKRIAPADYFQRLAGIDVPPHGLVSCPSPAHEDATPSCHVGRDAGEGWCCHGCGARGAIYDLASLLIGGPTGRWLRGEDFRRARAEVHALFGER